MNKIITILLTLAMTSASYAVVIGNWENMPTSGDGWIDWSNNSGAGAGVQTLSQYAANTSWSTLGSQSLQLTKNGWSQTLSNKLEYNGLMPAFLANSKIEFDMAVPNLSNGGGWCNIENITVNAPGWGFTSLASSNYSFGFWAGSGTLTHHFAIDYSAAKAAMGASPGYIEIVLTTNNDNVHNTMLFDNFQLTPEPATMGLLGLGGLALIRRKR